ncbi:MAG TPA: hypothetical protein PL096_03665 [Micropepsaceae bacterium]|nr:hypothetical protein [Micropepsaceae bacterium]
MNNNILNGQVNLADTWAVAEVSLDWIEGCVSVASVAIGNTFSASLEGSSYVSNHQRNTGIIGAETHATVTGVEGYVNLNATAIANNATIETYNADSTVIHSTQISGGYDPSASVEAYVGGVGSDVSVSGVAVSNNLGVASSSYTTDVATRQTNSAGTYSTVSATIEDVAGNVDVTSAAIANSVSISASQPTGDE